MLLEEVGDNNNANVGIFFGGSGCGVGDSGPGIAFGVGGRGARPAAEVAAGAATGVLEDAVVSLKLMVVVSVVPWTAVARRV